jgi:cytochrome c oxidase cbb3-type subunit 3
MGDRLSRSASVKCRFAAWHRITFMLRVLTALLLLAVPIVAQHGSSTTVNPYTKAEDIASGAALYMKQCSGCHGLAGQGTGAGPSLNTGNFRYGGNDEALFQTITKGVAGTTMPAFAFSGLQTWQLVTHLRQLSMAGRTTKATGNAAAGEALFRTHCLGCHREGPDLAGIGNRASLQELRQSILNPNDKVPPEFWRVQVTLASGQTSIGTRLNEDTHSIQIRDKQGQLRSFSQAQITKLDWIRTSPMPSFENKFSAQELEDLITHLTATQKDKP